MFFASAVVYLAAGIRSGDWLVIIGSVIWVVACVVFLRTDGAFGRSGHASKHDG